MATTTVTGHGRRSSMRQPELQVPNKPSSSQPVSSPIDKFPPYDESLDNALNAMGANRPNNPNPNPSVKYAPSETWEPRKTSFYSREHPNGTLRNPKHRPRKSISEAITTIRTRNGSVSANAQELAEALRAPVSYRLVVCSTVRTYYLRDRMKLIYLDPLRYLVLYISPHKHIFEIYSECSADANHVNDHSIRIRLDMVSIASISVFGVPTTTAKHPGPQAWYPLPVA